MIIMSQIFLIELKEEKAVANIRSHYHQMEILGPYLIWMAFKNIYEIYSKEPKGREATQNCKTEIPHSLD